MQTGMRPKDGMSGGRTPRAKRGRTFTLAAAAVTLGAGASVMAPGAQAAPAPHDAARPAAAVSCYDGAWRYDKPSGWGYAPTGPGYYVATNRCADIQVMPDNDTEMKVCVLKDRDPSREDCTGYGTVRSGRWTVLKKRVPDGAYFYFRFTNTGAHKTGLVAA
ncbi:hypothetical protein GCM10010394_47960 [Streptomyces crystallinus]|uniref:Uncharacterized protein n=1 Tax=Streptomyces crystallinus TaxID=68191 RepID=A0ABP3RLN9_9ACTN